MNDQQLFDIVVGKMIQQGAPSIDYDGNCCYRGLAGRKCPVGHLITDKEYRPNFEGKGVVLLITDEGCYQLNNLNNLLREKGYNLKLLLRLQEVHDECAGEMKFVPKFLDYCEEVAHDFQLEWHF